METYEKANFFNNLYEKLALAEADLKAGRVSEGLTKAYQYMISGEGNGGALQLIRETVKQLKTVSVIDDATDKIALKCDSLFYELEELAYQINSRIEKCDFEINPKRYLGTKPDDIIGCEFCPYKEVCYVSGKDM